jgi:hypothetical protein
VLKREKQLHLHVDSAGNNPPPNNELSLEKRRLLADAVVMVTANAQCDLLVTVTVV